MNSFGSGLMQGLGQGMQQGLQMQGLKNRMTQQAAPQLPATPFPAPGQDVPFANEMQVPYGPQQQQPGFLSNIMKILGGMGG